MGAITKVPRNATGHITPIPKESIMLFPFTFGYTFSKKNAEILPAMIPTAMAAPIFTEVPATDPYMMAPVIVPSSDPRIPNFSRGLMTICVAQLEITLALSAKKMEMKASCQIQLRQDSLCDVRVYLRVKMVVLAVNPRKRKKVPKWARMTDFYELLKEGVWAIGGLLRRAMRTSP